MVKKAWNDVLMRFSVASGQVLSEPSLKKLKELFKKTIQNGIEKHGADWGDPELRDYGLRHVAMIASLALVKAKMGDLLPEHIEEATTVVVEAADPNECPAPVPGRAKDQGVLCVGLDGE